MKRFFKLSALMALMTIVFVACDKSNFEEQNPNQNIQLTRVEILASLPQGSRAELGDDTGDTTPIYWSEGDQIVITIADAEYTFDLQDYTPNQEQAVFRCEQAPATLAAGNYTARYKAGASSEQSGLKSDLGNYQPMSAEFAIAEGEGWSDVKLHFCSQVAILKLTLSQEQFKGKSVSNVVLKDWSRRVVAMASDATVTGDMETGAVTVYFAVAPQAASACSAIEATCNGTTYGVFLSAKALEAGKLYRINKTLSPKVVVGSGSSNPSNGSSDYILYTYSNNLKGDVDSDNWPYIVLAFSVNYDNEYEGEPTIGDFIPGYEGGIAPWRKDLTNLFGSASSTTNLISHIEIGDGITAVGEHALSYLDPAALCIQSTQTSLAWFRMQSQFRCEQVYINSLEQWCNIRFAATAAAPWYNSGGYLYLNGERVTDLVIPESVTTIQKFSFLGGRFNSITLHEQITTIGELALRSYSSNVEVFCKAINPPAGSAAMFSDDVSAIHVPAASAEAYKSAAHWEDYKNVIVGDL